MKPGLPAGTRVQMRSRSRQQGVVMPYEPEYSHGRFPVRLDNCIWQTCRRCGSYSFLPTGLDPICGGCRSLQ